MKTFTGVSLRRKSAFTLIELLIVVLIIAILAAIAMPNFLEFQVRAKVARVKHDMRSIATAIEAFRVDNGHYPPQRNPTHYFADVNDPLWSVLQPGDRDYRTDLAHASLTSPISYLSSAPHDPFLYPLPNREHQPGSWQYGTDPEEKAVWVLESVGPNLGGIWYKTDNHRDLDKPYAGGNIPGESFRRLYVEVGMEATYRLFVAGDGSPGFPGSYDPTNGSISTGDIFRFSNR